MVISGGPIDPRSPHRLRCLSGEPAMHALRHAAGTAFGMTVTNDWTTN